MPYFGTGYFSFDEKLINISVSRTQDMRCGPGTSLEPSATIVTLTLSLPGPNLLRIVSNDQQTEK